MATYLASDVHLRLDRPERGRRFARFVDRLGADDRLIIGGDLCDFWYASRQSGSHPLDCAGLRSLAGFRARGGDLAIIAGNHDAWLGRLYRDALGVDLSPEPFEAVASGLRVHLVHGHRLGARASWKAAMESRAFLDAFSRLPGPIAGRLDHLLGRANRKLRDEADRRHLAAYREYAHRVGPAADLVAFGHIHLVHDDNDRPRLVVLGGWHHRASYLKIDEAGARMVVEED